MSAARNFHDARWGACADSECSLLAALTDFERAAHRLDAERLAAAINSAQIQPAEIRLGRDLRVVADRIAAAYNAAQP